MTLRLAVVGAGLVGRRHIDAIRADGAAEISAIADPAPAARDYAANAGLQLFNDIADLLAADRPDGIILATPNHIHVEGGLACIAASVPVLVEKPLSTDVDSGMRLVEAAESAGVPLLVGHHRRHNPLVAAAKKQIETGVLGRIVAAHGMCWLMKPDEYFKAAWRSQSGAGPVFINLIHDIDLLRYLVGEVVTVTALDSNNIRKNDVEDSAAILLRFANGALGTLSISDTIVSPWSWELTAAENPAYPVTDQTSLWLGGTHGALALPDARIWSHTDKRSWWEPIENATVAFDRSDPLIRQIAHFRQVISQGEQPIATGREGLKTLAVVNAIKRSVTTGQAETPVV